MTFRVTARTLLHLGAELISSDATALYELIKNAYDARSPSVRVDIDVPLRFVVQQQVLNLVQSIEIEHNANTTVINAESMRLKLQEIKQVLTNGIDLKHPKSLDFKIHASQLDSLEACRIFALSANKITVRDRGVGMSRETLEDAFLTIGTRSKRRVKSDSMNTEGHVEHNVLGEKGIGRLSSMRLGNQLRVETATKADSHWNVLEIDWSVFDHESEKMLDEIKIAPGQGREKSASEDSGTTLIISGLKYNWTHDYVTEIARDQFARLNDPFDSTTKYPIVLTHNSEPIVIPTIPKWLIRQAHAHCTASLKSVDSDQGTQILFSGRAEYGSYEESFSFDDVHLLPITERQERKKQKKQSDLEKWQDSASVETLSRLVPLDVEFYWFNRQRLTALDGVGNQAEVRKELKGWTGGLAIYRDGFRVLPYGNPDDDWLGLDVTALSRPGYKLNRSQIVGRVAIKQRDIPELTDQANREGFVDSDVKTALRNLSYFLVQHWFWGFLTRTEKVIAQQPSEPVRQDVLAARLAAQEIKLEGHLRQLIEEVPEVRDHAVLLRSIREGVAEISELMKDINQMAKEFEQGRSELLNLAGVGLTVEILAHELNRATDSALITLRQLPPGGLSNTVEQALKSLDAQLKTLQKRLKVLDPMSTTARNRKEKFDLVELVRDLLESHHDQLVREEIETELLILPTPSTRMLLNAVRGMVVQIFENLMSNSVFWLSQKQRLKPDGFTAKITIQIDVEEKTFSFSDNGPGIPRDRKYQVFEAFFTTRPTGAGKGLGLYIAQEIAKYHDMKLQLHDDGSEFLHTFVLNLGGNT